MAALSVHGLMYAEGTLETQLVLICFWSVLWFLTISYTSKKFIQPWISSKKWKEQWLEMHNTTMKKSYGVDMGANEEVFECCCDFLMVLGQHAFGGVLCLPSVLGFEGPVVWAMACHGALCEAGWEFQDLIKRSYEKTLGNEKQKKQNPAPLLVILGFHHAMGLGMVVPMNIMYGSNAFYHEFVFLLQGAAFVALAAQNYGYTLDVHTRTGLAQMRACVFATFATMLWSRLFRYVFIGYKLTSTFYADGHHAMLYGAGFVLLTMGLLNCLMVADACGKFWKFMFKMNEVEQESLPRRQNSNSTLLCSNAKSERQWAKIYKGVMKEAKKQQ